MADRPEKPRLIDAQRARSFALEVASRPRPTGNVYPLARWALWLESEVTARTASLAVIGDAWARYQRNDLSREEFEGTLAEHAAEHVGAAILARTAETEERAAEDLATLERLLFNKSRHTLDEIGAAGEAVTRLRAALAKAQGGEGG